MELVCLGHQPNANLSLLSLAAVNINGWTTNNSNLRKHIIEVLNKDMICSSETQLSKEDTINVDGYSWPGFN